jgi:uracil-DNA glycosylase family 4
MDESDKREKLKEFYLQIRDCQKCGLCKNRTKFVFGSGSAYAEVMFVGEAPGKNEDLQGLPFVGQAGKLLDELLASIGFDRNEVFIANVLKCRPPGNRDPQIEEINICKDHLMEQIKIIDPKIICTLGKYSTQLLLNTDKGITGLRGKVFRIDNRIVMPINHPAAALYMPSKMEILKQDFQKIKKLLDSDSEALDSQQEISSLEPEDKQEKDEQLGLF